MGALYSLYSDRASRWPAFYRVMQNELSVANGTGAVANSGTLMDFGNQRTAGLVTASTWTGRRFHANGLAPIWTPSEALSAFATGFDLRQDTNFLGYAPILTMNGTDEEADTPDAAFWTRALAAFSVGAWVNMTDATSSTILAKFTTTGDLREWRFDMTASDYLRLIISDETDAVTPNATIDTTANTGLPQGRWVFVVATYDGTANATGIDLYQDGVVVASTDTDDANFASMRDTTAVVEFGKADGATFFDGKILGGPWSPFFVQTALTAAQISNIFQNMRLGLGV